MVKNKMLCYVERLTFENEHVNKKKTFEKLQQNCFLDGNNDGSIQT